MSYVDVAFIHSPIGGFDKRLITFSALRALQEEVSRSFVCNVGASNFYAVSNITNAPSFATRFARRRASLGASEWRTTA